ncbi:MAG: hypothetical protein HY319_28690 [Armatimonadetes bacterium]|nr:hypothetical protein [Armatimonadota bacterium]
MAGPDDPAAQELLSERIVLRSAAFELKLDDIVQHPTLVTLELGLLRTRVNFRTSQP